MPQTIWTGTISFGLVSVPVRLYPATRKQDVRFHELDRVTGRRIRHERVRDADPRPLEAPASGFAPAPFLHAGPRLEEELAESVQHPTGSVQSEAPVGPRVAYEDVVRGYEVAPRQYVAVSRDELEAIAPERSRSIDLEQFVDASAVDPIYFQTSYYVVPDRGHLRSFALLIGAMKESKRYAIGWIVLRRHRHLAILRPHGGVLLLTTMFHADEVLPDESLQPVAPADLTRKEREMAALLVNILAGPFEPGRYRDEYRQRVKDLIAGKTPVVIPSSEPASNGVADLMAALRASVEQARKAKRAAKPARLPRAASQRKARRGRKSA